MTNVRKPFGPIFLKYISASFEQRHAKLLADQGDYKSAIVEKTIGKVGINREFLEKALAFI